MRRFARLIGMISLGMVVATYFRRAHQSQRMLATIAWVALILGYMKILLDRTGDPIYPVHWNLLANIFGRCPLLKYCAEHYGPMACRTPSHFG